MPGMDGTGPRGLGPMTGGGRGRCNPYSASAESALGAGSPYFRPQGWEGSPGYGVAHAPNTPYGVSPNTPSVPFGWGRGMGRGFGRGMGRGRGRRWW